MIENTAEKKELERAALERYDKEFSFIHLSRAYLNVYDKV